MQCDPTERKEMQRLKNTVNTSSLLCLCQPCCFLLHGKVPLVVFPLGFGTTVPLSPGWEADDDDGLDCWCGSWGLKQGPGGRQPWDWWQMGEQEHRVLEPVPLFPLSCSLFCLTIRLAFYYIFLPLSLNLFFFLLLVSPLFSSQLLPDVAFSIIYCLIISPFTVLSFLFSLPWIHLVLFSSLVLFIMVVDFINHSQHLSLFQILLLLVSSFFLMKAHSHHRSLICCVVLTLVLLNLIPLSLFSSVFNFSPLTLPLFSLFVLLRVPLGSTGTLPHVVSPILQHETRSSCTHTQVEMLSEPKCTWRTRTWLYSLLWESTATVHTCRDTHIIHAHMQRGN